MCAMSARPSCSKPCITHSNAEGMPLPLCSSPSSPLLRRPSHAWLALSALGDADQTIGTRRFQKHREVAGWGVAGKLNEGRQCLDVGRMPDVGQTPVGAAQLGRGVCELQDPLPSVECHWLLPVHPFDDQLQGFEQKVNSVDSSAVYSWNTCSVALEWRAETVSHDRAAHGRLGQRALAPTLGTPTAVGSWVRRL